ncbi:hypothetical protein [Tuwongella immobilis]|uniref:Uncharacterized protein n=1 Tax=Tuwongella immobilis TaxID=692036 RepID=A0A6C2YKJ4_9BACT|nr:hypothetical protein [Tuwongella immobilis]VIP01633.1 unnamed protein product [Tuwongella immobilis]VTR98987.1 unnamed protein product [Tuwongella immobilis]
MNADPYRIDRLCLRYLDAIESGNLDVMAELWGIAEQDDALATALGELLDGLAAEENAVQNVRGLVQQHLLSGNLPPPTIVNTVTLGDVARQLKQDARDPQQRLSPEDEAINDALLQSQAAVPDPAQPKEFNPWLEQNPPGASQRYRRMFRKTAMLLWMAKSQEPSFLMAARPVKPKPPENPQ